MAPSPVWSPCAGPCGRTRSMMARYGATPRTVRIRGRAGGQTAKEGTAPDGRSGPDGRADESARRRTDGTAGGRLDGGHLQTPHHTYTVDSRSEGKQRGSVDDRRSTVHSRIQTRRSSTACDDQSLEGRALGRRRAATSAEEGCRRAADGRPPSGAPGL